MENCLEHWNFHFLYIVMCQVQPALVKRVLCTVRSCHCLEPGWFVGDPTPLARDNVFFFNV